MGREYPLKLLDQKTRVQRGMPCGKKARVRQAASPEALCSFLTSAKIEAGMPRISAAMLCLAPYDVAQMLQIAPDYLVEAVLTS